MERLCRRNRKGEAMKHTETSYSAQAQSEYRRLEIEPKIAFINWLIGVVVVLCLVAAYSYMEADKEVQELRGYEAQKALSSNDAYLRVAELREVGILNDARHLAMPLQVANK